MFYTYLWLREDGTPYYVGKGMGARAYRKGSPSRYRVIIQEHPCEADAFAVEKFLITYYGRKDLGTGILHNHTDGGEGTSGGRWELLEESRNRISVGHIGLLHSEETKSKISKSNKGHAVSEETRHKLSVMRKGKALSEETRKKMSTSRTGIKPSEETKSKMRESAAKSHQDGRAVTEKSLSTGKFLAKAQHD